MAVVLLLPLMGTFELEDFRDVCLLCAGFQGLLGVALAGEVQGA